MKKIYTLILLAFVSGSVVAQTAEKSSKIKFGVKAGVNFAKIALSGSDVEKADKDGIKSLTSFQFSGYVDIPVAGAFSMQPGITLNGKGTKQEYSESDGGDSYKLTGEANIMYLEVPVNAVYKIKNFYLGAGPYAAFAISGKSKIETTITEGGVTQTGKEENDLKFGNDVDKDNYKSTDFGINILASYQLKNGFNVGVNYGLGLTNLKPKGDSKYKGTNRVLSVTVGFAF